MRRSTFSPSPARSIALGPGRHTEAPLQTTREKIPLSPIPSHISGVVKAEAYASPVSTAPSSPNNLPLGGIDDGDGMQPSPGFPSRATIGSVPRSPGRILMSRATLLKSWGAFRRNLNPIVEQPDQSEDDSLDYSGDEREIMRHSNSSEVDWSISASSCSSEMLLVNDSRTPLRPGEEYSHKCVYLENTSATVEDRAASSQEELPRDRQEPEGAPPQSIYPARWAASQIPSPSTTQPDTLAAQGSGCPNEREPESLEMRDVWHFLRPLDPNKMILSNVKLEDLSGGLEDPKLTFMSPWDPVVLDLILKECDERGLLRLRRDLRHMELMWKCRVLLTSAFCYFSSDPTDERCAKARFVRARLGEFLRTSAVAIHPTEAEWNTYKVLPMPSQCSGQPFLNFCVPCPLSMRRRGNGNRERARRKTGMFSMCPC